MLEANLLQFAYNAPPRPSAVGHVNHNQHNACVAVTQHTFCVSQCIAYCHLHVSRTKALRYFLGVKSLVIENQNPIHLSVPLNQIYATSGERSATTVGPQKDRKRSYWRAARRALSLDDIEVCLRNVWLRCPFYSR